ncbi:hypothetical protein F5Y03DRAFT_336242 [Xylaria venustula]|nr:hypothetical protein F5Y03DRAFT_336242 [Xylaria venustula]
MCMDRQISRTRTVVSWLMIARMLCRVMGTEFRIFRSTQVIAICAKVGICRHPILKLCVIHRFAYCLLTYRYLTYLV